MRQWRCSRRTDWFAVTEPAHAASGAALGMALRAFPGLHRPRRLPSPRRPVFSTRGARRGGARWGGGLLGSRLWGLACWMCGLWGLAFGVPAPSFLPRPTGRAPGFRWVRWAFHAPSKTTAFPPQGHQPCACWFVSMGELSSSAAIGGSAGRRVAGVLRRDAVREKPRCGWRRRGHAWQVSLCGQSSRGCQNLIQ